MTHAITIILHTTLLILGGIFAFLILMAAIGLVIRKVNPFLRCKGCGYPIPVMKRDEKDRYYFECPKCSRASDHELSRNFAWDSWNTEQSEDV